MGGSKSSKPFGAGRSSKPEGREIEEKDDEENRTRDATMTLVGVRRMQVAGHESMLFFFSLLGRVSRVQKELEDQSRIDEACSP